MSKVSNIECVGEVPVYHVESEKDEIVINNVSVRLKSPKKIKMKGGLRDAFICPEGYVMLNADYAAEELRVMANLSNENNMIQPLLEGQDIHNYIAKQMFGFEDPSHRTKVKILNFAVNYGAGAPTIASKLGISRDEAQKLLDHYNSTLSNLTRWKEEQCKEGRRKGMVFTYFGRPRMLYMYYNSSNKSDWAFGYH